MKFVGSDGSRLLDLVWSSAKVVELVKKLVQFECANGLD